MKNIDEQIARGKQTDIISPTLEKALEEAEEVEEQEAVEIVEKISEVEEVEEVEEAEPPMKCRY